MAAVPASSATPSAQESDDDSDFGYNLSPEDEDLLLDLASQSQPRHPADLSLDAVAHGDVVIDAVPGKTQVIVGDAAAALSSGSNAPLVARENSSTGAIPPEVESRDLPSPFAFGNSTAYPDLTQAFNKSTGPPTVDAAVEKPAEKTGPDLALDDGRSPLQKFRSYPKRPLTVTDLTSGAWCELQYWYTLTRLPGGRRTRTPAMKQGTKVHKKLEDEVHTTVPVEVMTKEDGFGLKLWNFVQGLRTLRETGLTRELEVWGTVDGNLVNGVIDGVTHQNPDPEFEAELSQQSQEAAEIPQQASLTDYFPPKRKPTDKGKKAYLFDVKTRGSLTPVSKAMLRPAKIQLLLYRRFLCDMAAGRLDFMKVFRRYGLDPDDQFSDSFLAQITNLHEEIFVDAPQSHPHKTEAAGEQNNTLHEVLDSQQDLLKYNSLRELVQLVTAELKLTFPAGEESLGHMLRVQYLYRGDGQEIDSHVFPSSVAATEEYLADSMPWWRGERKADGVAIEEAFKCYTCEFKTDCSWRIEMDEKKLKSAQRKMSARKSIV